MPEKTLLIKTDHDAIIELGKDVKYIGTMLKESKEYQKCMFKKLDNNIQKQHTVLLSTAKACDEKFVFTKTFWRVAGALFVLIVGCYGYASAIMHVLN